jgi:hypothetical protein
MKTSFDDVIFYVGLTLFTLAVIAMMLILYERGGSVLDTNSW